MSQHLAQWARAALVFVLTVGAAYAQTGTITGLVTDADTGEPLPGANVVVAETTLGTITDADGRYALPNVPVRPQAYTVRASFTGFTTAEQAVTIAQAGQTATVNFRLRAGVQLDAVVVTALGMERQERELGYSVSQIRGDEVTGGDNTNVIQALSGRIAGLDITQSSGSVGASSRIIIRGVTSLSADNQPLFVIDGVPISNENVAPTDRTGSLSRIQGAPDTGNRANDINPGDIESITVLRGGAAAALYGNRARNGVIMITTRRGLDRPRAQVQLSSSLLGQSVGRLPNYQNDYAQGTLGAYSYSSTSGWGPRIAGQTVQTGNTMFPGVPFELTAQPNNVRDFFQTGLTSTNNLSFSTGTPTTDFRMGVGYITQQGIVPASELDRISVSVNAGTRLANQVTARVTGNYITTEDLGRTAQGSNDPNILMPTILGLPRTIHPSMMRQYRDEFGNQVVYGQTTNNPYWVAFENPYHNEVQRVFGSGTIGFEPLAWLNLSARVGTDFYTQNRRNQWSSGTLQALGGRWVDDIIQQREVNADVLGRFNHALAQDISLTGLAGFNINSREYRRNTLLSEDLSAPGVLNPANAANNNPSATMNERRLYGVYGDVTLGWRDAVFLNLTGRNDVSSTLPVENRSYFYPSAALSVVFTDLVDLNPEILSYGKFRVNAARVGSDEDPYQLQFRYFPVQSAWSQFNTHIFFPYLGDLTAFDATGVVPPADLRPQQTTTYEIGTELGFLNDRVSVDLTLYDQVTSDQILSLPAARSTGFTHVRMNVGEVSNRGFEATLNAQTLQIGNFSHSFRTTFATNRNRVVELAEGVDFMSLIGGYNNLVVGAEPGAGIGLYGTGWLRDEDVFNDDGDLVHAGTGQVVIDPSSGLRVGSNQQIRLGDLDPNFRVGFSNTFRFGPVSLSALLDWRSGGVLYSQTVASMRTQGLVEETLANRDGILIDNGVILEYDAAGNVIGSRPNDVPVTSMQSFWQQLMNTTYQEASVWDASFVKLREVTVTFDLPRTLLQRTPFGQAAISLEGRNLALLYSRIPHIDPEVNLFGSGSVAGSGYEFNSLPATRNFGVNLSLTF